MESYCLTLKFSPLMKKLEVIPTIKEGIALALVNYLSIVCAVVLYVLTIWIPYLNVGTTIAMASLPAEMAKGNVINPLFIFKGTYLRYWSYRLAPRHRHVHQYRAGYLLCSCYVGRTGCYLQESYRSARCSRGSC